MLLTKMQTFFKFSDILVPLLVLLHSVSGSQNRPAAIAFYALALLWAVLKLIQAVRRK